MRLSELKPGARGVIRGFDDQPKHRLLSSRLMEMGMTVGAAFEIVHEAPFGGAIAVRCRGSLIALRLEDAKIVAVETGGLTQ